MEVVKLYRTDGGAPSYWEAWEDVGKLIVHQGALGEDGDVEEIKATKSARERVRGLENEKRMAGYRPISEEEHAVLRIVYRYDGTGPLSDPGKRQELEDSLDHTLGWTGLGHCDGLDFGEGILVAACLVVDSGIARRVIEADLEGTAFEGYAEISPA
jgi:hypothetical protein